MTMSDKLNAVWAFSGAFWLIFYLVGNLAISGFLSRRYKFETKLIDTAFFAKHAVFVKYLPDFLSGGFFATHLIMCAWGWRLYGNRKMFRDIGSPKDVLQHFTEKEIRRVKIVQVSGGIVFIYMFTFFVFKMLWPQKFV